MKLSDISALIFDMDGLVLDSETTYSFAKQQAAQALGLKISEQFWMSLSGLHTHDVEQKILAHCGPGFNLREFNLVADKIWREHVTENGIKTKHGFLQLMEFIVKESVPFCLATNSNRANAEECLKLAGLQAVFPIIVTRDDVRQGKPEPDIFLKAADRLRVDIKSCLVLEDSHTGILAASRAGAYSVFVPSQQPIDALTLSLCNMMMGNLEQLLDFMRASLSQELFDQV